MGAGASIPDKLDVEAVKALLGDKFSQPMFDSMAIEGNVLTPLAFSKL
jgi:hypothetical protein